MFDDWLDPSDPLDPLDPSHPFLWAEWVCPDCAEDGDASDLLPEGRCPNCRAKVEPLA